MKFTGEKAAFKLFTKVFNAEEISKRVTFTLKINRVDFSQEIEFKSKAKDPISEDDQKEIKRLIEATAQA